jgi:hypothetical protein
MPTPTPLFPVAKPSTLSTTDALAALAGVCHVIEVKGSFALVHASPIGVVKITDLGLEVFHTKKGGEYYAVKVGALTPAAVKAPKSDKPADGIVRLSLGGSSYLVKETATKRKQDVLRFEVTKDAASAKTYVVSYQDAAGCSGACSCPDWIYRRHACKHIVGVKAALVEPRAARAA